MTYLEALYGSQYQEITSKGRNGASGRLNGNLFLSAFVIICVFLVFTMLYTVFNSFGQEATRLFHKLFGYTSGKTVGKALTIPLLAIVYFTIAKTVGSVAHYDKLTKSFMEYPEDERKKANMKILKPFFIALGLLFILSIK